MSWTNVVNGATYHHVPHEEAIKSSIINRDRIDNYSKVFARRIEIGDIEPVTLQNVHNQKEHIQQNKDQQGLALPGTKYTGPGNSLNRGVGINQADEDARIHDEEYNTAKSHQNIQEADLKLLQRAGSHIVEGISGQGTIGDTFLAGVQALGIGSKYLLEKAIGPIYPAQNFLTGKTWHHLIIDHSVKNIII